MNKIILVAEGHEPFVFSNEVQADAFIKSNSKLSFTRLEEAKEAEEVVAEAPAVKRAVRKAK